MYPSMDRLYRLYNYCKYSGCPQNVNHGMYQVVNGPAKRKRDVHVRIFVFLMTIIALVKMYTSLCGSECEFSNGVVPGNVEPVSCVALQKLKTVLCSVFGHTQFRPGPLEAMLAALHGKDGIVKWDSEDGHRSREITLHVPGTISIFLQQQWGSSSHGGMLRMDTASLVVTFNMVL